MHINAGTYFHNWLIFSLVFVLMIMGGMALSHVEAGYSRYAQSQLQSAKQHLLIEAKVPSVPIGGVTRHSRDTHYPAAYSTALHDSMRTERLGSLSLKKRNAVQSLYEKRDYRPIWTRLDRKPSLDYKELLRRLENSWTHGLNPDQYRVQLLQDLAHKETPMAVATREILASDALIRYISDLVGPRTMDKTQAHTKYGWRASVDPLAVLRKIGAGRDPDYMINALLPDSRTYAKMRDKMRELARQYRYDTGEKRAKVEFDGILRPGDSHDAVRQLRKRLDVPPQHNRPDHVYGDPLAKAVTAFQAKNGLDTDAIVGPATRKAMNRTAEDKIDQLIANMQRMRWLSPGRPDRYLLVNIPAARLWAVDEGRVVHHMDVIAGRPSRETASFVTRAEGVRLNPEWSIPYTVKFRDVLPKIRKDPGYLAENDIKLVKGYGRNARQLNPGSVDWDKIPREKLVRMRMIQQPGAGNPLGHIRILMPNRFSIFLHDTDEPEYFDKGRFWLSSGCVRMRKPEKVADFVMNTTTGWSRDRMQNLLKRKEPVDLEAGSKTPVYILYHTIWQRSDGELVFGPDIYNRDDELVTELQDANQIYIPEKDELAAPESGTLVDNGTQKPDSTDKSLKTGKTTRLLSPEDPA